MASSGRWRVHGALDLGFAALYGALGFGVVRGRSRLFEVALGGVIALLAVAGGGLLSGARWGRAVAIAASVTLLGFAATVIALLVASAAYLRGIYGPLGEGMSLLAVVAAALVLELCGLLPLFQLRALLGDRRATPPTADDLPTTTAGGAAAPAPPAPSTT